MKKNIKELNSEIQRINKLMKEYNVEVIDIKCIDLTGRLHHISLPVYPEIIATLINEGVGFDGSSYGFRKVESSDMILVPDLATAVIDPFRETKTLSFYANIFLTDEERTPFGQDGRHLARMAEELVKKYTGGDTSWWGPEFEFYIFSKVKYDTRTSASFYEVEHAEEFFTNAYHAANPFDVYDDFRDKACKMLKDFGIKVKYHHHETGERGQQEIETYFETLLKTADNVITVKYALFNLARQNNIHITFMPKPMFKQPGSGMHVHTFLTKNGKNAFYKKGEYGNVNELGRYFIGGLLKNGRVLSAFTNPSTNSYKRLVPGFEAPVALTYSKGNRSSAIRIPSYVSNPEMTRFEFRPPDSTANPYLCLSAILMAGIDGIINKIDPVKAGYGPFEKNILDHQQHEKVDFLPRNLEESLDALEQDSEFLRRDNVFSDELIKQWIENKHREINSINTMPHPFEYKMYFTL
jgi:glutamine synthetase